MTKTVKLTQNYINLLPKIEKEGLKFHGDKHFSHVCCPNLIAGVEFYKKTEALDDPANVPIYDSKECDNVIRTESMECYGCYCGENMEMNNDTADELISAGIIEEVI